MPRSIRTWPSGAPQKRQDEAVAIAVTPRARRPSAASAGSRRAGPRRADGARGRSACSGALELLQAQAHRLVGRVEFLGAATRGPRRLELRQRAVDLAEVHA